MEQEQLVTAYLCMTKDIGVDGNLFGGTMMAWIDESAGIFAHKYTGVVRMVTLKYSELLFKCPVRVGDLVEFYASKPRVGRTSLTFELEGRVGTKSVVHTVCTFVSVDENGRPTPIPPLPQRR